MSRGLNIVTLPGDGVGPEVLAEACRVVSAVCNAADVELVFQEYPFGGAAVDEYGVPLPEHTREACIASDAVLLGAVGGSKWDALPATQRPESGLLKLRKTLGAFANLRPVWVPDSLLDVSPLRPETIRGTDILVVRELTGGIYFGRSSRGGTGSEEYAESVMRYHDYEVERIAHVAFLAARRRKGKVLSVDKANVLDVSRFWRDVVVRVHDQHYGDIEITHAYIDSAAVSLVQRPTDFDVVLTSNLFGDILSDIAAALPGSLGMLASSCIGGVTDIYEPVHGSAPDIAGTATVNPCGAILSGALLLHDAGFPPLAKSIRVAVEEVLREGYRTPDIATPDSETISTHDLGSRIAQRAAAIVSHQSQRDAVQSQPY